MKKEFAASFIAVAFLIAFWAATGFAEAWLIGWAVTLDAGWYAAAGRMTRATALLFGGVAGLFTVVLTGIALSDEEKK